MTRELMSGADTYTTLTEITENHDPQAPEAFSLLCVTPTATTLPLTLANSC